MNYYEHHLGDYLRDTAHLSMVEDAAYRRLLDMYYVKEAPLPADVKACCKLARAISKAEKDAVALVLREFFELREDGYHQARADAEISRYREKSQKAKRSAEARWGASERNANASADAMRTHSEGNALQSPVTSNQSKNGADAPTPLPTTDPRKALWDLGKTLLGPKSGGLISAAIKRVGEEKVAEVLGFMATKAMASPVPYFEKATAPKERGFVC